MGALDLNRGENMEIPVLMGANTSSSLSTWAARVNLFREVEKRLVKWATTEGLGALEAVATEIRGRNGNGSSKSSKGTQQQQTPRCAKVLEGLVPVPVPVGGEGCGRVIKNGSGNTGGIVILRQALVPDGGSLEVGKLQLGMNGVSSAGFKRAKLPLVSPHAALSYVRFLHDRGELF